MVLWRFNEVGFGFGNGKFGIDIGYFFWCDGKCVGCGFGIEIC